MDSIDLCYFFSDNAVPFIAKDKGFSSSEWENFLVFLPGTTQIVVLLKNMMFS